MDVCDRLRRGVAHRHIVTVYYKNLCDRITVVLAYRKQARL
ncbi:hypothetical protein [Nostoc sp. UHCC 0251]|nr:hypothetical protein [Nostoc sp. UHCC 0251]MEA5625730.1 hypothetical protein [Nostoc sp. UHCC 0251]